MWPILLRDQWLVERWCEAMGTALVGNKFSRIPSKISFHMKKKKCLLLQTFSQPSWLVVVWTMLPTMKTSFCDKSKLLIQGHTPEEKKQDEQTDLNPPFCYYFYASFLVVMVMLGDKHWHQVVQTCKFFLVYLPLNNCTCAEHRH